MDPFWQNAYDDTKDRRYGMLFFGTLLALFITIPVLAIIYGVSNSPYSGELFAAVAVTVVIFMVVLCISAWRWVRGWKRRQEREKYASLSRDELFKARSKLKKSTTPVTFRREQRPPKRPPPSRPDTNLKY
jgi:membrane protein implicated in regulation of membrane protease activity